MKKLWLGLVAVSLALPACAADTKKTAQEKPWTDQYEYGDKSRDRKTDPQKPSEGEFQIAPAK